MNEIDFGPIEADVGYALGEIQDLREYVDGALADRLEGIEARLKELTDTLYEYLGDAASNPHGAAYAARRRMFDARTE